MKTRDMESNLEFVRHGTPQGSSLSSLLFVLYINDLLQMPVNGYFQMFADDAILIYSNDSHELYRQMQTDLNKISDWLYDNYLTLNASKTKYMVFNKRNCVPPDIEPIYVNGKTVERTEQTKYLGLIIDQQLSWKLHITYIKNLLIPYVFVLRQSRYLMPRETKIALYYSHIHSHLSYMSSIWGYGNSTDLRQLQVLQNKAIRNLFWQDYQDPMTDTEMLRRNNGILSIDKLILFDTLCTIHKLKHGMIRNNFQLLTFRDRHEYNTRGRDDFMIPPSRLNVMHDSTLVSGLASYNCLPAMIKNQLNLYQFKKDLKSRLNV